MSGTCHSEEFLLGAWEAIQPCARDGLRCPENHTGFINTDSLSRLAWQGKLRIEISGHNWRTVKILQGEHAGKSTKPNPTGHRVWKIIDENGSMMIRREQSVSLSPRSDENGTEAFAKGSRG